MNQKQEEQMTATRPTLAEFHAEAIRLTELGYTIMPIEIGDGSGKKPMLQGWNKLRATPDLSVFTRNTFNIGMCLHNCCAFDVDVKDGGLELFHTMVDNEILMIPANTPWQRTGSGGRHYIFKQHPSLQNRMSVKLQCSGYNDIPTGVVGWDFPLQIIISPSKNGKTQGQYIWNTPLLCHPDDLPDMPEILVQTFLNRSVDIMLRPLRLITPEAFFGPEVRRNTAVGKRSREPEPLRSLAASVRGAPAKYYTIKALVDMLDSRLADAYSDWCNVGMAIWGALTAIQFTEAWVDLFSGFSAQSSRYDAQSVLDLQSTFMKTEIRFGMPFLHRCVIEAWLLTFNERVFAWINMLPSGLSLTLDEFTAMLNGVIVLIVSGSCQYYLIKNIVCNELYWERVDCDDLAKALHCGPNTITIYSGYRDAAAPQTQEILPAESSKGAQLSKRARGSGFSSETGQTDTITQSKDWGELLACIFNCHLGHHKYSNSDWIPTGMIIRNGVYAKAEQIPRFGSRQHSNSFNTWLGFPFVDVMEGGGPGPELSPSDGLQIILNHLLEVWCDGNQVVYTWVIKFFASIIQQPDNKPGTGIFVQSQQGAGKNIITQFFAQVFGTPACLEVSDVEKVLGRFNSSIDRKLLIVFDEVTCADASSGKVADRLKHFMTQSPLAIEEKGKEVRKIPVFARAIFFTNHKGQTIPIEDDDRRYCVLQASSKYCGNTAYFNALHRKSFTPSVYTEATRYLASLELEDWNGRTPPNTNYKTETVVLNQPSPIQFLLFYIDMASPPEWARKKNNGIQKPMYDFYRDWCRANTAKEETAAMFTRLTGSFLRVQPNNVNMRNIYYSQQRLRRMLYEARLCTTLEIPAAECDEYAAECEGAELAGGGGGGE
jgi:hypothetical protein